ncbi:MAG: hypothetical protein V4622_01045 [Bacteroidota bacterium]
METQDFDSVFLKKYIELSSLEKEEMKDLFSNEDEFNHMKFTLNAINNTIQTQVKQEQPSAQVKERLDFLYNKTYQNKGILWYNSIGTFFIASDKNWYNQNLVRIAAVLVVIFSIYPFLNVPTLENKVSLSSNEEKTEMKTEDSISTSSTNVSDESAKTEKPVLIAENKMSVAEEVTAMDKFEMSADDKVSDASFESTAGSVAFSHPDGIFMDKDAEVSKATSSSFSIESNPDFLDLLTPTF